MVKELKNEPMEKERFFIGVSPKGSRGGNFYKVQSDYSQTEDSGAEAKALRANRKLTKFSIHKIDKNEKPTSPHYEKYFNQQHDKKVIKSILEQ